MEPDCWNFRFIEDAVFEGGWMMKRPAAPRNIIRVVATAARRISHPIPSHICHDSCDKSVMILG